MESEITAMRQAAAGIGHIRDEIERMTREDFWAKAMRGGSLDNAEDHMGESAADSAENGSSRQGEGGSSVSRTLLSLRFLRRIVSMVEKTNKGACCLQFFAALRDNP